MEQIVETTGTKNVPDLERTLLLMTAVGKLVPVSAAFQPATIPETFNRVRIKDGINRKLIELGRQAISRQYLVAPAVGSGLALDSLDAVALAQMEEGVEVPKLAASVGEELRRRGVRVNKDGVPIADEKEAQARTDEIVGRFLSRTVPVLMRYGVVEAA
jgi:hypothetical protein